MADVTVLAHYADPIAIIGFFGPALVLVAGVVTAVVLDRRRDPDDDDVVDPVLTPPRGD